MLTSDIENEQHRRVLLQRLEKFNTDIWVLAEEKPQPTDTDYLRSSEYLAEGAQLFTEGAHLFTELATLFKERTIQNTDLYTAMSRLTKAEFDLESLLYSETRAGRHDTSQCKTTTTTATAWREKVEIVLKALMTSFWHSR
ncbi:uncharacterized protein N7458_008652 [Penicillium daleae]|uniref:Uncharacterized protein n=1 Tax=Penicillium daleae TaxID=63821 RepID=A0AAD6C3G3_9EURO|nr:uncharacterized protein N7458_008652 [Penicillium daleae]KAJ5444780.1 hypothetical protein N7458_008652 [Penicillium daleae]